MDAASIGARSTSASFGSRRLLALAGDERLVEQIRRGNDAAFETVFDRYAPALLAFCRHMLGSREEAEDAVQLTFAAAHSDLIRQPHRSVALKPWLFTIARNRCLSMLRARREQPAELAEIATEGLGQRVQERDDLRQLLADLRELPDEQRAALLLAEVSDLSHAQVAEVLGCEVPRVKALVFRARSALIDRRSAREASCSEIQQQLANLRGGSLRRSSLRLHLRECASCRTYREQVRIQRSMLAAALPVTPTLGLKSKVLAVLGLGGASTGGGASVGLASLTGALGSGALAKVAVVAVVAGGGAVAAPAVVDSVRDARAPGTEAATPSAQGAGAVTSGTGSQRRADPGVTPSEARAGAADPGAGTRAGAGSLRRAGSPGTVHGRERAGAGSGDTRAEGKAIPPGQANRDPAKGVPPGQAKKAGEPKIPPGQAKEPRPPQAPKAPPGQSKSPGGPATGHGNGANGPKVPSGTSGPKIKPANPPKAPKPEKAPAPAPAVEPAAPAPPGAAGNVQDEPNP